MEGYIPTLCFKISKRELESGISLSLYALIKTIIENRIGIRIKEKQNIGYNKGGE